MLRTGAILARGEREAGVKTTRIMIEAGAAPDLEARVAGFGDHDRESESQDGSAARDIAVVAPPHPLMGGSLDHPVVEALADGLAARGAATLQFNWRGAGASQGTASGDIDDAVEDYRNAIAFALEATGSANARCIAAGYSFGAVAAVKTAADCAQVCSLVLVAPPLAMMALPELCSARVPVDVIIGERDEYAPVDVVERSLQTVRGARLEIVPDADHFFSSVAPDRLRALVTEAAGRGREQES